MSLRQLSRFTAVFAAVLLTFPPPGLARDGIGRMAVQPTQLTAGTAGNSLVFTYTADSAALRGITRFVVPPGWTKPQFASPTGAGYVRIGRRGCAAGTRITGINGRIVTIQTACARGAAFQITYSGVTAPVIAAGYTFLVETKPSVGKPKAPPHLLPLAPAKQPVVAVIGGAAKSLQVMTTSLVIAGTPFSFTARAVDVFGNTARDSRGNFYMGTLSFTSTDPTATLPAPYTLTPGDFGSHTFRALVLNTPGEQTIRVTDASGIAGESAPISVSAYS